MIKIGIYSDDSTQKKYIKKVMSQYFEDLNIQSQISYIRTKSLVLKNITDKFVEFNIVIMCDGDKIIFVKRNDFISVNSLNFQVIGWFDSPFNNEKINKIIKDNYNCPQGRYQLNTKKVIRAISYEDIECFKSVKGKTMIYLIDNEVEETNESIKSIKGKLFEEFFVDCIKGHIVNFYNIKKIDRLNHTLIMKSGYKISIARNNLKSIIRLYFKIIFDM